MAKRNLNGRKSGGNAGIAVIEDSSENNHDADDVIEAHVDEVQAAPQKARKAKAEPQTDGNFGVGDIRKAAAFVNSIGGLDKALTLLQILKVAKEVQ